ncbi:PrsW family intramembrane metalloprotease [Pseudolysinimonas sp.]|uniref:PrsW family intramembrane metalloprotease n=1 Tax=Pseudolysinimonas sp. TaxID=2680009 RepID=UPI003F8014CD
MSTPAPQGGPPPGAPVGGAVLAAPADMQAHAAQPLHPPQLARPRRDTGILLGAIIGYIVVGVAILLVIAYLALVLGGTILFIAGFMALIPLTIVLLGAWWLDRWEPEPIGVRIFAFLWGAGSSIVIALLVDTAAQVFIKAHGGPNGVTEFVQAVVQAPMVEEGAKGLGVLLIFLVANKYFDGPVDGIVYAATVAAGFAFSENIQYFGLGIADAKSLGDVIFLFVLRGLLSPFAHAMFTSMTGLFIGLAALRGGRWLGVLFAIIGWIPAVLLHAFWNGSLSFVSDFFGYYLVVQVPLFVLTIVMVVLLRRREVRLTQQRLGDYAAAGWFNQGDIISIATPGGRRQARAWAAMRGVRPVMKNYIRDATRLALTRNRIVVGRDRASAQLDEAALLTRISTERAQLRAAAAAPVAPPPPGF